MIDEWMARAFARAERRLSELPHEYRPVICPPTELMPCPPCPCAKCRRRAEARNSALAALRAGVDQGSVMRVGTYRLSPDSARLVYRWEGWQ